MRSISAKEFPPELERIYRKARRLQWVTLAYITSSAPFLYLTMGSSQAMRATFFEEVISAVPAISYLICTVIARRNPTADYPYGMHRATSIGHLVSALALTAMGFFLLADGAYKLLSGDRASIGSISVFGTEFWAGWPMLLALLYSAVPPIFLGRVKHRLAPELHDKILFADAGMMKAGWMAESAAAVGVVGLGLGIWWLDPIAAALVSLDIVKDGISNLRVAVTDLIDRRPKKTDQSDWEPLPEQVRVSCSGWAG
jgi:divalent metal cation (Fe/Co/Zn/Cd) transporter